MKITKNIIKKLIKEELKSMLDEGPLADAGKEIGDWTSGRNPGLVDPRPKMAKANGIQVGEPLNMINAKLDQILHLLNINMRK